MPTPRYYKDVFYLELTNKINSDNLQEHINWADENYDTDNTDTRFKVAYTYKAIAEVLEKQGAEKFFKASEFYHFSGHHLRFVENYRNAGIVYGKAGELAYKAAKNSYSVGDIKKAKDRSWWAVRSFSRGKNSYSDVGDNIRANQLYIREQNIREYHAKLSNLRKEFYSLKFWRISCNYGESFLRWLFWVLIFVALFSTIYEIENYYKLLDYEGCLWKSPITGIYYSLVTLSTLGYGDITPNNYFAQLTVIANIILGYFLLGVGISIVSHKMKK